MSLSPLKSYHLPQEPDAVRARSLPSAHSYLPSLLCGHVVGEADVDVVEISVLYELLFATQEEEPAQSMLLALMRGAMASW